MVLVQPCEHLHCWHSLTSEDVTVYKIMINKNATVQFALQEEASGDMCTTLCSHLGYGHEILYCTLQRECWVLV